MRHHSGAEHRLHDLFSRGMLVRVASALDLDARLDEFLIIFREEIRSRRVVGEVEERQKGAEDGDQALDDELEVGESVSTFRQQLIGTRSVWTETFSLTNQRNPSNPAAPFMWPTLIHQVSESSETSLISESLPISNASAKCTSGGRRCQHEGDTDGTLLNRIPEGYQIDDACTLLATQFINSSLDRHVPGKKPASNIPAISTSVHSLHRSDQFATPSITYLSRT